MRASLVGKNSSKTVLFVMGMGNIFDISFNISQSKGQFRILAAKPRGNSRHLQGVNFTVLKNRRFGLNQVTSEKIK